MAKKLYQKNIVVIHVHNRKLNKLIYSERFECVALHRFLISSLYFLLIYITFSREILQPLLDVDLSNEEFPFSTNKIADINGKKVRLLRMTFAGEMGKYVHDFSYFHS
jgi:hypothetical protein